MSKLEYKAGNFKVTTWTDGYPFWIEIEYEDQTIKIHHNEIKDLQFCLQRMYDNGKAAIFDGHKHEFD